MLHLHNFNYKFRLKTWVAAATRNYVINNRRNGAKWAELSDNIDPVDEDTEEEESALNDLKQAITELSTEEQHIIDLYYYKSYNMTKIGLIYGINRNKVSKRIHAILEKLKLKLK
jgi:RNA polymerase sigma factor (sigma-70 family)